VCLLKLRAEPALFTEKEALFLCHSQMARVATVSADGQPHVVPVAFEFDGWYLYFSGRALAKSLKFRHLTRNDKVALVIDDVVSISPWYVRGIEIRGTAELLREKGHPYVRITPLTKASWGL
jgi:pyridoxamine 5'-phosphate oxidase family protein